MILQADGIQLSFGGRTIISDVHVTFSSGEIIGLLGRNGSGKSSLLKAIFGSMFVQTKSVQIDGHPHLGLSRRIAYQPQDLCVPKHLTVRRVFQLWQADLSTLNANFPEVFEMQSSKMNTLSMGEQRLVESIALLTGPADFVLMDEPFTGLAPIQVEKLIKLMQSLSKGIVVADHAYRNVLKVSSSIIVLRNGKSYPAKNELDLIDLNYILPFQ